MPDDRVGSLYRQYGPAVYARCRGILRNAAAAEDATQETFVRVFRHLASAPDDARAKLWLYRIATNLCVDRLRAADNQPHLPLDSIDPPTGKGFDEMLADQDLAAQIIARAPPKLRAVAWLTYVDDLGTEAAAKILNVTARTVRNRLAEFLASAKRFAQKEGK